MDRSPVRHVFPNAHPDDGVMEDLEHHGLRTAWLAQRVASALGLDAGTVEAVGEAARLHDIGKQHVAPHVLQTPGRLGLKERRQVEMHAVYGAWMLLSRAPAPHARPDLAVQVALLHHEWWNGRGYPFGLSGTTIPLGARVVAVADVFDALVSERCYKPAWSIRDAQRYLLTQRGRQFDPLCADAMHRVAAQLPADWALQALQSASPAQALPSSHPTLARAPSAAVFRHLAPALP